MKMILILVTTLIRFFVVVVDVAMDVVVVNEFPNVTNSLLAFADGS